MVWKTGTLKTDAANSVFLGLAVVTRHRLGYYEATLINGETLSHQNNTQLGMMVIDLCIKLGLKRQLTEEQSKEVNQ